MTEKEGKQNVQYQRVYQHSHFGKQRTNGFASILFKGACGELWDGIHLPIVSVRQSTP